MSSLEGMTSVSCKLKPDSRKIRMSSLKAMTSVYKATPATDVIPQRDDIRKIAQRDDIRNQ